MRFEPIVIVADVGSVSKGGFHWVSSEDPVASNSDPKALATRIAELLSRNYKVALGFESPLFVPCREEISKLGKARIGECTLQTGNKSFSAPAGSCVLVTGMQILAWILRKAHTRLPSAVATTRWKDFNDGRANLFVWEAFVSGKEKGADQAEDARRAMEAFIHHKGRSVLERASCISESDVFSVAGAAILFASLSADITLLKEPCIVLRPVACGASSRENQEGAGYGRG